MQIANTLLHEPEKGRKGDMQRKNNFLGGECLYLSHRGWGRGVMEKKLAFVAADMTFSPYPRPYRTCPLRPSYY